MFEPPKYVKLYNHEAEGGYTFPISQIDAVADGEIVEALRCNGKITLTFEATELTDEEYNQLPEFQGY